MNDSLDLSHPNPASALMSPPGDPAGMEPDWGQIATWVKTILREVVDHPETLSIEAVPAGQLVVFVLRADPRDQQYLRRHRERPLRCLETLVRIWGVRRARRFQLLFDEDGHALPLGEDKGEEDPRCLVGEEIALEHGIFRALHRD